MPLSLKITLLISIFIILILVWAVAAKLKPSKTSQKTDLRPIWSNTKEHQMLYFPVGLSHTLIIRKKNFLAKIIAFLGISGFLSTGDSGFDKLAGVECASKGLISEIKQHSKLRQLLIDAFASDSRLLCIELSDGCLRLIFENDNQDSRVRREALAEKLAAGLSLGLSKIRDTSLPFRQSVTADFLAITLPLTVSIISCFGIFAAEGFVYLEPTKEVSLVALITISLILLTAIISRSYSARLVSWVTACTLTVYAVYSSIDSNIEAINELAAVPHATLTARVYGVTTEVKRETKRKTITTYKLFLSDISVLHKTGTTAPITTNSYVFTMDELTYRRYYETMRALEKWTGPDKAPVRLTFYSGKLGKVFLQDISLAHPSEIQKVNLPKP